MSDSGPVPVIVDCDPGIDDAVALALVAASPELELRAVTTVRGNVPVDLCTRNAARALAAFGRPEVPVAGGATRPLVRSNREHPRVHGHNGLGDVELPAVAGEAGAVGGESAATDSRGEVAGEPAADRGSAITLLECVLEPAAPGEITLIALAPLTNIALLLDLRPDLADRIGLLAAMGATVDRGNITPFAEFNVWADPEAAHRVLAEGALPTRLYTLAATRKAAIDESQRLELATWSTTGEILAEMIKGYDDRITGTGWPLHDAMVIADLLDPGVATFRRAAAIEVDTSTAPRRGHTAFEWIANSHPADRGKSPSVAQANLEVAIDADPTRFRTLLKSRISRL